MSDMACGVDVHKDELVATVIGDSLKERKRYVNDADDISCLKRWLKRNGCSRVVMESSGVYWVSLYLALEDAGFDVSLANARQVVHKRFSWQTFTAGRRWKKKEKGFSCQKCGSVKSSGGM